LKKDNILVVGAGFAGAVIARELAEAGCTVTVIDKRDHIAGNAYDYEDNDIRVHKYGPHIFHTDNKEVFDWLSRFTGWVEYKHKVKALLEDGTYVTLPPNRETKKIVGEENIIDVLYRPYTKKMWAMEVEELDASVINRVKIRDDDNEYYFPNSKYQFMPKDGWTAVFTNIFNHENITVKLGRPFHKGMEEDYDFIFNSMPIDQYFNYIYGHLPYRSIQFQNVWFPTTKLFPTASVNFTGNGPCTRVTEWKNLPNHGDVKDSTLLTFETPCDYRDNAWERYYPVKDKDGLNRSKYKLYKSLIPKNMEFIGRCGLYVYIDIHQAIASSLASAKQYLGINTK
jgi:UDP-galactopyranose mutase